MKVEQISIFLENKSGRLAEIARTLGDAGVNIRALSLADTSDFGILRLIVNDREKAKEVLKEKGFTVSKTEVVAIEVPDRPGGLFQILHTLDQESINVEYMYAFVERCGENAVIIFRFDETEKAIETLLKRGFNVLEGERIYRMGFYLYRGANMLKKLFTLLFCMVSVSAANSATAAPPIKIGALFAVTGPASFLGEPERNAAQMVVDEINKAGGIKGRQVQLITYDTQGDATRAVQAATRLIRQDRVSAIIGPSTTGDTMAIIPLVEKARIPLVSCSAGIKITEPVKSWVYKTAQNDSLAVAKIYEHLAKNKSTRVAILTVSDSFGSSGREQLKLNAPKYGIQIISDDTYGPKDTDMTPQLTKIRGSNAQALICWGTNPGPAIVARNVRQLGIKIPVYMSHGVSSKKFIELAGSSAEGIMLPSGRVLVADLLPDSDRQKKSLLSFKKDYQIHFNKEGDHFAGHAWDAMMLLKTAIERGGDSPSAIRDQLEKTRNFAGIGGVFNFSRTDHSGLGKDAFVLVKVKNKNWILVR